MKKALPVSLVMLGFALLFGAGTLLATRSVLKNYQQIEAQLDSAGQEFAGRRAPDERRPPRRIPAARLVEILFRSQRIDRALHRKLRDLITLNNAIIHGADPVVSEQMVSISAQAAAELKTALEKPVERRPRLGRR